jgi:hypothetical protein
MIAIENYLVLGNAMQDYDWHLPTSIAGQGSDSVGVASIAVASGAVAGATDLALVAGDDTEAAGEELPPLAFIVKSTQDSYVCFDSGEFHHHCNTQSPATAHLVPKSGMVTLN